MGVLQYIVYAVQICFVLALLGGCDKSPNEQSRADVPVKVVSEATADASPAVDSIDAGESHTKISLDVFVLRDRGDEAFKSEEYAAALELYQQARSAAPHDLGVLYRIANAAAHLEQIDVASDAIDAMVAIDSILANDPRLVALQQQLDEQRADGASEVKSHALARIAMKRAENTLRSLPDDLQQRSAAAKEVYDLLSPFLAPIDTVEMWKLAGLATLELPSDKNFSKVISTFVYEALLRLDSQLAEPGVLDLLAAFQPMIDSKLLEEIPSDRERLRLHLPRAASGLSSDAGFAAAMIMTNRGAPPGTSLDNLHVDAEDIDFWASLVQGLCAHESSDSEKCVYMIRAGRIDQALQL